MQYGFSRSLYILIVYSGIVIYFSQCENINEYTAIASSKADYELNLSTDQIDMKNDTYRHNFDVLSSIPSSKRSARYKNGYKWERVKKLLSKRQTIGQYANQTSQKRVKKCKEITELEEPVDFKNSYFSSNPEDVDEFQYIENDKENFSEPFANDKPASSQEYLPDMLDDIDFLIDEFEKVSKKLDVRHRKVMRPPLDRSNKDIIIWENANRRMWKSRQHVNSDWSEWSAWTPCSVTCGQGIRMRSRFKLTENVPAEIEELQEKKCIMPDCPPFNFAKLISKVFRVR